MSDKKDDKINFKLNFKKETQKKIDDFRRIVKYFVILIIGFLIIKYISVKCSPIVPNISSNILSVCLIVCH